MPTLAELDVAHQREQAAAAQRVGQLVLARFLQDVDPKDVRGTSRNWLTWAIRVIFAGRTRSYQLAAAYATAVHRIQLPDAPRLVVPKPPDPPEVKFLRSLAATGIHDAVSNLSRIPDEIELPPDAGAEDLARRDRERQSRAERVKEVMQTAALKAGAAAYKHTVDGGRDTTDLLVVTKVAVGYQRITKEKPCSFCLMLASRGPVYSEDSFDQSDPRFDGPGEHKVHDTCGCGLRPVFVRGEENWTEQARTASSLWQEMLEANPGAGGKDARNAFASMVRERGLADLTRW